MYIIIVQILHDYYHSQYHCFNHHHHPLLIIIVSSGIQQVNDLWCRRRWQRWSWHELSGDVLAIYGVEVEQNDAPVNGASDSG